MSNPLLRKVFCIEIGTGMSKLVMLKLADNANGNGVCFPSHRYLAAKCEISERSVRNQLTYLVKHGWIEIQNRTNGKGGQRSNFYFLNEQKIEQAYLEQMHQSDEPSQANSVVKSLDLPSKKSLDLPAKSRQSVDAQSAQWTGAERSDNGLKTASNPSQSQQVSNRQTSTYPQGGGTGYRYVNETERVSSGTVCHTSYDTESVKAGTDCRGEAARVADYAGGTSCRHNLLKRNKKTLSANLATLQAPPVFDDQPFSELRAQVNLEQFALCRRALELAMNRQ
ncbi:MULTISPECIES: helix-turn-helix domain-containing protein [unclassified Vibrio]|uniref:Helix-turn-helix domain-containing protein n=1 Tax=Vibrio sp. HB236076 TaxID=3232307 RepID=A0AB39HEW6_9VIBR|nr:helix-turn-helix domain-containing protein [Vibrio sp. HB161653]MDP5252869.1 helix-turn-helix domain-containing protein [Vibrio sp. HB161653]